MRKNEIPSYDFRKHLQQELKRRNRRNPAYSVRAFAKFLKTDPSVLAKLLSGKRPLGELLIQRFSERLGVSKQDSAKYIEAHKRRRKLKTLRVDSASARYQILTLEELSLISNWYDYAILELVDIKGFRPDLEWISFTLRIPRSTVESSVKNLTRLGMIEVSSNGDWSKRIGKTTTKPTQAESKQIRMRLIRAIMEKALAALDDCPDEKRSHTAMTFAADSSQLPEAIEKIRAFRTELADFLQRKPHCDQVYQLAVALYPLSGDES